LIKSSRKAETTVTKADEYRRQLNALEDWDVFLLRESGLPGPRGNLELAQVVADLGTQELFERYLGYDADQAPTNSPYEFLAFCGVVGLGRLLAEGRSEMLATLRQCASDRRWRIREAVAMALQRLGDVDMSALIQAMKPWSAGTPLEQRAAAAALCEPRLLGQAKHARAVLHVLDKITASLRKVENRKSEDFLTLRKGLGYCWSVAVAALPDEGKRVMDKWLADTDPDVRWIMKENLKKKRLARVDAGWVKKWQSQAG
jgi:3-methyladenine DNA glycosylase AlkC